jgi:hypothetical protein
MITPKQPPRIATRFLRACCPAERVEDLQGDLLELFVMRCERFGIEYAQRHYRLEVFGICLRQLGSRMYRSLARARRVRRILLYPLRVMSALLVGIVLLIPFASEHQWARSLQLVEGCAYALFELLVYFNATSNLLKAVAGSLRSRRQRQPRDG